MENSLFSMKERNIDQPSGFSESPYSYLDDSSSESAAKVRNLLDQWFNEYPQEFQTPLKNRFRSSEFKSAFFELYLFGMFTFAGIPIVPLSDPEKRTPDFLVFPSTSDEFYLEATIAVDEYNLNSGRERIEQELYDYLNAHIKSNEFFIHLHILKTIDRCPQFKQISEDIENWLLNLENSKNETHANNINHEIFINNGWKIDCTASRISPKIEFDNPRVIGSISTDFQPNNTVKKLKDAIEGKAQHYGKLTRPLMVAVNVLTLNCELEDIVAAMFGKQIPLIPKDLESKPTESSESDGAWFYGKRYKNKRVSAILITSHLNPWNVSRPDLFVFHHPQPYLRISQDRIPFKQFHFQNGEMNKIEGKSPNEIFNLSNSWPE